MARLLKSSKLTELVESLPKAPSLHVQWVRCGSPGCRCTRGQLHGPYYYRFWREDGRLRKRYVRLDDVAAVRASMQGRREHERHARQVVALAGWTGAISQPRCRRSSAMGNELVPADVAETAVSTTLDDAADEISSLARDLARGYADFVETYRTAWGIIPAEADAQLRQPQPADIPDRTATEPPDQVSWWRLSSLVERDPEAAIASGSGSRMRPRRNWPVVIVRPEPSSTTAAPGSGRSSWPCVQRFGRSGSRAVASRPR